MRSPSLIPVFPFPNEDDKTWKTFKEKIEEERLLVIWGKRKDGQPYIKKPKKGVRFTDFAEGITKPRFKKSNLIEEGSEIDEAQLEEFANDKKKVVSDEDWIKKIGRGITWGAFLEGAFAIASFATGQLWMLSVLEAYRAGDFAYKIAKKLEDRQVDKAIDELVKRKLSVGFQRLSDQRVNEISGTMLCAFCETGLSDMIAGKTALDRNVVDTMFQNTVDGVFDNGIENLVDFAVDII